MGIICHSGQRIHLHLEFLKCSTRSFSKFYNLAGFILQSCTWEKNHFAGNLERAILIVIYIFHYLRFENNDLINI